MRTVRIADRLLVTVLQIERREERCGQWQEKRFWKVDVKDCIPFFAGGQITVRRSASRSVQYHVYNQGEETEKYVPIVTVFVAISDMILCFGIDLEKGYSCKGV